ncbi:hypothetical protein [Corynebacterium sp. 13CS0277]|uniref:hypothetical protein n=1 Tax=Corynebacterium sp. 13CS0277 TaxID=2071994 RepID=UPI0011B1D443|nr:hypothetical protein [Corynebacterium sp. 13CS0277]
MASSTAPMYVRLDTVVDGMAGPAHVAEVVPLPEGPNCTFQRYIEMADGQSITGGKNGGRSVNLMAEPMDVVPHPDTYGDFEGINVTPLTAEEFEALWQEAIMLHPELAAE